MKYLKLYEEHSNDEPQIGDYVYCVDNSSGKVNDFIKNRIGQILQINDRTATFPYKEYLITYDNRS